MCKVKIMYERVNYTGSQIKLFGQGNETSF